VFRRINQIVLTLLILCDLAVVLGSWNFAYWLRFYEINLPRAEILHLTPHSLEPAVAQGLPLAVRDELLEQAGRSYTSAYELRQDVTELLEEHNLGRFTRIVVAQALTDASIPPYAVYARVTPVLLLLAIGVFYAHGVYRTYRLRTLSAELRGLLGGAAILFVLTLAATFFYRQAEYSRIHMLYFGIVMAGLLILERTAIRLTVRALRRRGMLVRRFVLVGDSPLAAEFYERFQASRDLGLELIGLVTPGPTTVTPALQAIPRLGAVSDLPCILTDRSAAQPVDQVVSAFTLAQHEQMEILGRILDQHVVDHRIVPDLGRTLRLRTEVETFDGMPLVVVSQGPLEGWNQVFKRAFDLAGSVVGMVVFSPFFLTIPILIKLTSPGPVLYVQERMSWNGRRFGMMKFRSMPVDAENKTGAVWASEHDARPTRLGAILRKSSLDEIPQFLNVLLGDMSLVGPRPERPVFIDEFKRRIPGYMLRHKIKAGITGWAQVNGWRGNTSLEKRIECDLYYISNWSIGFDFRILVLTLFRGFFSRNAY
jgi:Undecaprenyl-phosphate glucose phosphotransferase